MRVPNTARRPPELEANESSLFAGQGSPGRRVTRFDPAAVGLTGRSVVIALISIVLCAVGGFIVGTLRPATYVGTATVAVTGIDSLAGLQGEAAQLERDAVLLPVAERFQRSVDDLAAATQIAVDRGELGSDGPSSLLRIRTTDRVSEVAGSLADALADAYIADLAAREQDKARAEIDRAIAETTRQLDAAEAALADADSRLRQQLQSLPVEQRLSVSNAEVDLYRAEVERITAELSRLQRQVESPTLVTNPIRAQRPGPATVGRTAGSTSPARTALIAALGAIVAAGLGLTFLSTRNQNLTRKNLPPHQNGSLTQ